MVQTQNFYGTGRRKSSTARVHLTLGKDMKLETDPTTGPFTNFDCDIVYSNGVFLSYPDGLTFNK